MKTVVAALIKKDNKYLIAKRSTGAESMVGFWEFPGGKVEPGESEQEALEREILEELNMAITVGKKLAETKINDGMILKLYECTCVLDGEKLHDHSEVFWFDKLESFYDYDLAEPDLALLETMKPLSKKPHLDELTVGAEYTNDDLKRIFCVSRQGGMRKSTKANCLVLIAKHDDSNPYDDKWADGVLHYTGMGPKGDQSINYMYNKDLAESNENGMDLYLMEAYESNSYFYRGLVKLAGKPYFEKQKDTLGRDRRVVKFPLRLK